MVVLVFKRPQIMNCEGKYVMNTGRLSSITNNRPIPCAHCMWHMNPKMHRQDTAQKNACF